MNTELLAGYSLKEKEAYIGAIASIATVDRRASDEEIQYLTALAEATGVDQQMVEDSANDNSNQLIKGQLEILKHSDLKFALITDIITFAKSDGKLDEAEQQKINEISSYLGISHDQTNALGSFVEKSANLESEDTETPKDESFLEKAGLSGILKGANIPSSSILKGLLGIAAPIILSRLFRNRSNAFGNQGNSGGLLGSVFGGTNSSMGGSLGGGLLGSLLGGGMSNSNIGGLGSILGNLSGGRGYGGIGSVLGSLFQKSY